LRPIDYNFAGRDLLNIDFAGDTIYVGSSGGGFAISPPGNKWRVIQANTDSLRHDRVDRYVYPTISGNWITALGIQEVPQDEPLIWAQTRRALGGSEYFGIYSSTLGGQNWVERDSGAVVWNFEFKDSLVLAATSGGLIFSQDLGETWETALIKGALVSNRPEVTDIVILPPDSILGVEVVDDTVWIGSTFGAAKVALDNLLAAPGAADWEIYRVPAVADQFFAYPVPFSPINQNYVFFNYPMKKTGSVTIKVYDFAMNLVKTVIDGKWREGSADAAYSTDRWDGRNGRGDLVAAGIYYFKVEYSFGESYWGKLAIIP
ncbi:MAG: hypothetical protein JSV44_03890, partial [Candidatus Zixiibacteriota bacterium]